MMGFSKIPFAFVLGSVLVAGSARSEEVTLQGKILCARCTLKETAKCQNAIQVKDGDKTVTYYFIDKGNRESYHEEICGGGTKEGRVTGVVSEKDGKRWIAPSKVEYAPAKSSNASSSAAPTCCTATPACCTAPRARTGCSGGCCAAGACPACERPAEPAVRGGCCSQR
jgi:hypothetical protein